MSARFKALVVREARAGGVTRAVEERAIDDLPPGDTLIRVRYSSLNYKDALSATGHRGITRRYPHTPGIDAAGAVVESASRAFAAGSEVIVTGYDLGMNTPGGLAQYIRVPADWVVPRPDGLTLREAMMLGTAGFTAALSLTRLQQLGIGPDAGEVLVTGATGGVGSLAVSILARAGYNVIAATGKPHEREFLLRLGARDVTARDTLKANPDKPLLAARWAGVVDTVGGETLAAVLRAVAPRGAVTTCGMVDAPTFSTTVYPFILRGVALLGVDSAATPMALRRQIWSKLAGEWKPRHLDELTRECTLDNLESEIGNMLAGKSRGRVLVTLPAPATHS
ncbi:MAG: YhdH/YhfP family quinone oxidoreductase [Gammaproteobacteria bacterium]